jgi:hypothetical protein
VKIVVHYWMKPIPMRNADWEATLDNYEPGHPIGFGATQEDAVEDLRVVYELKYDKELPADLPVERVA